MIHLRVLFLIRFELRRGATESVSAYVLTKRYANRYITQDLVYGWIWEAAMPGCERRKAGLALVAAVMTGLLGGVIGLVGPFDTFALVPPVPRLVYWVGVSVASYAVGFVSADWLSRRLHRWTAPVWLRLLVIGGLPGVPIALSVWGING
ncbi:MAG: hypothetical protein K2Q10_01330, partial [Rhodospirillales bacterium]|nr:hypothetical protein [Rhodospirillales bacterium]